MKYCGPLRIQNGISAAWLVGLGGLACTGDISSQDVPLDHTAPAATAQPTGQSGPPATDGSGGKPSGVAPGVGPSLPNQPQGAALVAGPPVLRRLTGTQYLNSLRDLLGAGVTIPSAIEGDLAVYGLSSVGASRVTLSTRATEIYEEIALRAAEQAVTAASTRAALVGCTPTAAADTGCANQFVARFGRRAWRRPLASDEIARYVTVAIKAGEALKDPWRGFGYAIAGLLQSPNFLYRAELGVPEPKGGNRAFDDFEMASRLSFLFWDSMPDDPLLDAAARGSLSTTEGLRLQVDRLLAESRSRPAIRRFFFELLKLDDLEDLAQSTATFPLKTPTLFESMRSETLQVLSELAFGAAVDFRTFLDNNFTFVNDDLAKVYGLPLPNKKAELVRVALPDGSPRLGYLGQASFLALNARAKATSPTLRGKFVREILLCQTIPDPPPDTSTVLPPDPVAGTKRTMREKLDAHRTNPSCAGCHNLIDPIGFAFEHFDPIGAYRATDAGKAIDASGELDGQRYTNARELVGLLRGNPNTMACVVRNFYRHAAGRLESDGEEVALVELNKSFEKAGFSFTGLARGLVESTAFRQTRNLE